MIDFMTNPPAHHLMAYGTASLAAIGGVVAQAAPESSVGQLGAVLGAGGLTGLLVLLVREVAPPLLNYAQIRAANREANIRMQESIRHLQEDLAETRADNARLQVKLDQTESKADESERLSIQAKARADELEKRLRVVGHTVNNNAQKVDGAIQRLDAVEQVVGGSGSGETELAI